MGLTLMKEEMVQALGNKNVDEMQKSFEGIRRVIDSVD